MTQTDMLTGDAGGDRLLHSFHEKREMTTKREERRGGEGVYNRYI